MSKRSNNTGRTTPRDVNAGMRVTQALELRAKKLTYDEIASQCGYSDRASCYRAVQRELDRRVVTNVDEMRKQEADMLDQLHTVCWEMAIDKSNKGRLFAVDRVLAISERRAKLMGLDMKPDELLANQNYTKRIVLTHEFSTGGQDANTNS